MTQVCRLCDKEKKLIKAHIIPDWAHRTLKQDNHLIYLSTGAKERKIQSGYWDNSILCRECDGDVIGQYDTYAKKFFDRDFSKEIVRGTASSGEDVAYIHLKDFDYTKLKLFLVSVLWRASISNLPQFAATNLGKYEDIAKQMILEGKIINEKNFQIVLAYCEPPEAGKAFEKAILSPGKHKFDHAICHSFMMAGFDAIIKVSDAPSSLHIEGLNMHPSGFHVLVRKFEESSIGKYIARFKEQRRIKKLS
jgi:hypothetical protein